MFPRGLFRIAGLIGLLLLSFFSSQAQTFRLDPKSMTQPVLVKPSVKPDSLLRKEKEKLSYEVKQRRSAMTNSLSHRYQSHRTSIKNVFRLDSTWKKDFKLPPLVKFTTGQASLTQQFAERTGAYPVASPPTFTRFTFNGGASVLGIPLRVDALYSTEQSYHGSTLSGDVSRSNLRQPMNWISVSFDTRQLQQMLNNRINGKIAELEKLSQNDGLKDLEKLYKLESLSGPNRLQSADLEKYLTKAAITDSLQQLGEGISKKARKRLSTVRDSLYQVYTSEKDRRIRQAKGTIQSVQDSLHSKEGGLSKQARQYLETHPLTAARLGKLQHLRDSLQRVNPERLLAYENLLALKTLKEEGIWKGGMKQLKKLNLISLPESLLGSVQSVGIGTSYPYYSRYTLRNVPVTGVHAELQPGLLYLAFTASKNLSAVPENKTYARQLSAGRIGIGRKEENHFYLSFLYGRDDKRSFQGDSVINGFADTTFYNKPRENYVVGGEFKLRLSQWLSAEGEMAHSVTAMNIYHHQVSSNEALHSLFRSSSDTSQVKTGRAYSIKLQAELDSRTRLTLSSEYISAGFYSLGAPYLRNNLMGYETKLERTFFKRQLTIAPKYGKMQTAQAGENLVNTYMNVYGLKIKTSFKKLPYFVVDYTSYRQQPGETSDRSAPLNQVANVTEMLTLNGGYAYQMGTTNVQSMITASLQSSQYRQAENPLNRSVRNILFNQVASFSIPLQLAGNSSLMRINMPQRNENWLAIGGSLSYVFRGSWQSRVGLTEGQEQKNGKRQNWFVESQVKVWRFAELGVRVERNRFEVGDILRDYQELRGTISLLAHW